MTEYVPLLLTAGLATAALAGCGDEGSAWSELRAGPAAGGTVVTGTCGELEADCDSRCGGSFDDVECTGTLSGDFDDVIVPPGATCALGDTRLTGNLQVGEGGSVTVGPNVFVCGDLQGAGSDALVGSGTRVCGNLQVSEGRRAELSAGFEILKNLDAAQTETLALSTTLICADAQWAENGRVDVPAGAAVVVGKNCSADENAAFDFAGLRVEGRSDGCEGAR